MSTKKLQLLGSVLSTDATLTQDGVAADAKAVGDKIIEVNTVLDAKQEKPYVISISVDKSLAGSNEEFTIQNFNWDEMVAAIESNKSVIIKTSTDDSGIFQLTEFLPDDGYAIFGMIGEAGIKRFELYENGTVNYFFNGLLSIDDTLTKGGSAADAKAVGDAIDAVSALVGDTSVATQISDAVSQKSQVQIVTSDSAEILPTLKIRKLTQEEYEQEIGNGTASADTLYLTPEEEIDLSGYATEEYVGSAIAAIDYPVHSVNGQIGAITLTAHDVGALSVDTVIPSVAGLATEEYVDGAVAQKSQVQIITWEDDD